jgi:UDP-N-acetyl-D-galactosamine dehydrogenase
MNIDKIKIGVIGLGYVGLPLAVEFGKKIETCGFDINKNRIRTLKKNSDYNKELDSKEIKKSKNLFLTNNINNLSSCNIFIVTVPTPLKEKNLPDLSLIIKATKSVAKILKQNDIVIYESTVYPGVTEEVCVPILKKYSKLEFINSDSKKNFKGFYCGYSPERINPGDKKNYLTKIPKVISGSTVFIANFIKKIYEIIIEKPIHIAKSIKIAEAAKIIENTQRDLNIALANEFLMIFEKMNIDFNEVFKAASTKWNFLRFTPGLVGGHCIGIDPYYLTYKAKKIGYNPKLILAGRKINDAMNKFYFNCCIKELKKRKIFKKKLNILFLGSTFKENIADCRNSKVFNFINNFLKIRFNVDVFDPYILKHEIDKSFQPYFISYPKNKKYDCVIISVAHNYFIKKHFQQKIKSFCNKNFLVFDLKNCLNKKYIRTEYFSL